MKLFQVRPQVIATLALSFTGTMIATPSQAQHVASATKAVVPDLSSEAKAVLLRPVTVTLDRVSLARVLAALEASANVSIQYREDVLERAANKTVTLRAEKMSLGDALRIVLTRTNLEAVPFTKNIVTIRLSDMTQQKVTGVVTGKVIDSRTKQPVANATVTVDGQHVTTNADGTFRLSVANGTHVVQVRAIGFARQSQKVTVSENKSVTLEIALSPGGNVLDEVVVTGSVIATERKTIPTPITVITGKDLEERGITRIDQILRGQVPGVFAVEQGTEVYSQPLGSMDQVQVYSRGASSTNSSPTPLKIYIDGVELADPSMLKTLDTRGIERIEVITGPQASTIYGAGAMGGVMQIFMKNGAGQPREVSLALRYGTIESNLSSGRTPVHAQVLRVTGGNGPGASYSASLSHDYQGQWQPGLFSRRGGFSAGLNQRQGAFSVRGSLSITGGQHGGTNVKPWEQALESTGEYIDDNRQFSPGNILIKIEKRSFARQLSLNIDYNAFPWWQHHLTLGESARTARYSPQAPAFTTPGDTLFIQQRSNNGSMTYGYNTTIVQRTGVLSHSLVLGMNGTNSSSANNSGRTVSSNTGAWESNNSLYVTTSDARSIGGFGSWKVGVLDHLFLTLGLRGQHSPAYGRDHKIDWTPTNGLSYVMEFGDVTLKLMGSYGAATRTPPDYARGQVFSFNQNNVPDSWESQREAVDLRPEVSRGPQGGFELYLGNRGSIAVNRYRQTVDDLLFRLAVDSIPYTWASNPNFGGWLKTFQWVNLDQVATQGWTGHGTLNLGPLSLEGTWSWNESRIKKTNRSSNVGNLLNRGVPTHTGNGIIRYAYGATSANVTLNFTGAYIERLFTNHPSFWEAKRRHRMYNSGGATGEFDKPSYVKSDLNVSHRLSSSVSMTISVRNLGNSFASEGGLRSPTLGRQTTLAVTLRH